MILYYNKSYNIKNDIINNKYIFINIKINLTKIFIIVNIKNK